MIVRIKTIVFVFSIEKKKITKTIVQIKSKWMLFFIKIEIIVFKNFLRKICPSLFLFFQNLLNYFLLT